LGGKLLGAGGSDFLLLVAPNPGGIGRSEKPSGDAASFHSESVDTAAASSLSTTKGSFPEARRSMKPITTAKRLVFDRILQTLLRF
jgi:hypothetical protein